MGQIFISYARDNDEPFVKQLYQDLTENGIDVWWDRKAMESRGRTFLQELRDAIEASDRLIAVIGPTAVTSDYVKAEWEHALLFAKGVVPILRCGDYDLVPLDLSKLHCPDFRKERPYNEALEELLDMLAEPVPKLGSLLTEVPSLPPHFLPRFDEIARLGVNVLADIQQPTVITSARQTTALQGMGGVGKSVLAAAFSRAIDTRRAFEDGIIWLTIGQRSNQLMNMKLLGLAFDDDPGNYADMEIARNNLPRVLADKVCLIVLDDVWNVVDITPFRNALSPRCRLLITTRDGGLITALGAQEHRLDVLNDTQAQALLAQWTDQPVDTLPPESKAVAYECGNLPLALAIVGAMVRGKTNRWGNILYKLRNADLDKISQQFPNYPYQDILKAIQVSIEALEPEVQKRYLDFSVFPEKTPISEAVLHTFWEPEGLDEYDTQDIADILVEKSLAQRNQAGFLMLHDLQFDYVRRQVDDLPALHNRLLEAYWLRCTNGWSTGPNDGYFFEHLAYHLVEAGHKEELHKLLTDFTFLEIKAAIKKHIIHKVTVDHVYYSGIYELVDDFHLALDLWSLEKSPILIEKQKQLLALRDFLAEKANILSQYPELVFQCCYNYTSNGPLALLTENWLIKNNNHNHPWLRKLNRPSPTSSGVRLFHLLGHRETISGCTFADNDQFLVSIAEYDPVHVWDSKTGELITTINLEETDEYSGRPLLKEIAATDSTVGISSRYRIWLLRFQDWKPIDIQLKFKTGINQLVASGDSFFVAVGRNICIIDDEGTVKERFLEHEYRRDIESLAITANGSYLASIDSGRLLIVNKRVDDKWIPYVQAVLQYNGENRELFLQPLDRFDRHRPYYGTPSLSLSSDGLYLALSVGFGVQVFDLTSLQSISRYNNDRYYMWFAKFSPNGAHVAFAADWMGPFKPIGFLDIKSKTSKFLVNSVGDGYSCAAFSPTGRLLAVGSSDKTISIVKTGEAKPLGMLTEETRLLAADHILGCMVSFDKKMVAYWSIDHHVGVLDLDNGKLLFATERLGEKGNDRINSVGFSPNGAYIYVRHGDWGDSRLTIWNIVGGNLVFDTREQLAQKEPEVWSHRYLFSCAFSTDSTIAAVLTHEFLFIINMTTGQVITSVSAPQIYPGKKVRMCFDKRGNILFAASFEREEKDTFIFQSESYSFVKCDLAPNKVVDCYNIEPIDTFEDLIIMKPSMLGYIDDMLPGQEFVVKIAEHGRIVGIFPAEAMVTYVGIIPNKKYFLVGDAAGNLSILKYERGGSK